LKRFANSLGTRAWHEIRATNIRKIAVRTGKVLDRFRDANRAESRRTSPWRFTRFVVAHIHQINARKIRANVARPIVRVVVCKAVENRRVIKNA
jgi:hypothetical protein